jgi:hypothetical protein
VLLNAVSNVVYFETAFSSARAWSIWSYAYVAMAAVVIFAPLRAKDSYVVTEDVAQVGDRVDDFGSRRRGERTRCETGAGGSRFIMSEPVEQGGEDGQRAADAPRCGGKSGWFSRSTSLPRRCL